MDKVALFQHFHLWALLLLALALIFRHIVESFFVISRAKRQKLYQARNPIFFEAYQEFSAFKIKLLQVLDGSHFEKNNSTNPLYTKLAMEKLKLRCDELDYFLRDHTMYFPQDILALFKEILSTYESFISVYKEYLKKPEYFGKKITHLIDKKNLIINRDFSEMEDILRCLLESNDHARPVRRRWSDFIKDWWGRFRTRE